MYQSIVYANICYDMNFADVRYEAYNATFKSCLGIYNHVVILIISLLMYKYFASSLLANAQRMLSSSLIHGEPMLLTATLVFIYVTD